MLAEGFQRDVYFDLAVALALFLWPEVSSSLTSSAAEHFVDRAAYTELVLEGVAHPIPKPPLHDFPKPEAVIYGALESIAAFALAFLSWQRRRAARPWMSSIGRVVSPPTQDLQSLHSGHPGDYVAWLTLGVALLGGAFALVLS